MSEWFWKKLNLFSGWVALTGLFGLIIFSTNLEIKDLDLWLHLAMGRFILATQTIPQFDVLSFTVSGQPWVNHEWLFQVGIFSIFNAFGAEGLINFRVVLIGLTFVILLATGYSREKQLLSIVLLFLVFLIYQLRLTIRPDNVSLLFFVMFIYILAYQLDSNRSLLSLFLIQVVWTSVHGFFIFGPVLIGLMLFGEWMKRHARLPWEWNQVGRYSNEEYRRLKHILICVGIACFINPYTYKAVLYPLDVLTSLSGESKIFFKYIGELQKPITWGNLLSYKYFAYKALIALSALSFFLNRRKVDFGVLLLWIIVLIFSLKALRNIAFFAVIAYFVTLINCQSLTLSAILPIRIQSLKFQNICSTAIKVMLIFWMVNLGMGFTLRGYFDFDTLERKSEFGGISKRNFPYKAVDFLVENKIEGHFFNDFNSGAYLLGRAHPGVKVFIDGRTEVYGPNYFKEYANIWKGNTQLFEEYDQKYQFTGAFLNSVKKPAPAPLIRYLYQHPDWRIVYFDYDAAIFLKNIAVNKQWIDQFQIDLNTYQTPVLDIIKLGAKNITPYQHVHRAQALINMGFYQKAADEVQEVLKIKPNYATGYELRGRIYFEEHKYIPAYEDLRKAVVLAPYNTDYRIYLAMVLYHLKEWDQAINQCERVLSVQSKNSKVLFLLSLIYDKQQREDLADETLKKAYQISPNDLSLWLKDIDPTNQKVFNRLEQLKSL